ncbi:MAG: MBL fold metallo-hydrolase [Deltaproteobacteria bacterium]|nr:MBL fold metallo-hydrolase [Deltaproteobacteria bacterium]
MASLTLVRHATLQLDYGGMRLLVDPMLSPRETLDPAAQSGNLLRNPRVELPVGIDALLDFEECLLTHAHRDHLDAVALEHLPRDRPVLCQPEDQAKLTAAGFQAVVPVAEAVQRGSLEIRRVRGEHGRGEMIAKMGASSGFVLKHPAEPTLYLAGDTVWCPSLQAALRTHRPEAIVVNAGAAQFSQGGPVTLDAEGVIAVAREAMLAQVVVVHMEAWNHCPLTRAELVERLEETGHSGHVRVPADGETVDLA